MTQENESMNATVGHNGHGTDVYDSENQSQSTKSKVAHGIMEAQKEVGETVKHASRASSQWVNDKASRARNMVTQSSNKLATRTSENPFRALGVAFALGLVVATAISSSVRPVRTRHRRDIFDTRGLGRAFDSTWKTIKRVAAARAIMKLMARI